ncbi:hypothetical protein [Pelagicoccus sp. SDUM812003]|uniref:hypothetical protein n=1 Tax=Pelagicoccus sp. SDUM812003 TaxID=3041267 RepID=UPI00280E9678|nr:hypothetical protein [Pelagicoccus sp. SDUM812003]MDQ8204039.1 hypothetical protein [Pelagicoccus sp. SDUM812003]
MPTINSSDLSVSQPIVAGSSDPQLTIQVDSSNPLAPGSYRFQLVVSDESGNSSQPATVNVVVIDDNAPTAIIDAPSRVSFGANIILSGARSTDIGGAIESYEWTLIDTP